MYLYIMILFIVGIYSISKYIYLYRIGKYNPYIFSKSTDQHPLSTFGLSIAVYWSSYKLLMTIKPSFFIALVFFFAFLVCYTIFISVLNYLTYVKSKDRKIIYHTVVLYLIGIGFCFYMVNIDPHGPSPVLTNQLDQSKLITLDEDDLYLDGNTESNINNYGLVAETNDSIFYLDMEKNSLCRTDKDLNHQIVIFDQDAEKGKDTINVVGDWVFFRQGEEFLE